MVVQLAPCSTYSAQLVLTSPILFVGQLASFTSDPGVAHWHAIKHLFRYIKGTMDYAITYAPDPSMSQLFVKHGDCTLCGVTDTDCQSRLLCCMTDT